MNSRRKSALLPPLTADTSVEPKHCLKSGRKTVQTDGLGNRGLNLVHLSKPKFCIVLLLATFSVAHIVFSLV